MTTNINNNEALQKALNLCYIFLRFRPRSQKEIENYLQKKAKAKPTKYPFDEELIEKVIKKLKNLDLVDDKQFVEWYISVKSARIPKSQFLLKRELFKFGVPDELVERYFTKHNQDEYAKAKKALEPRWERFKKLSYQVRFQKAASFLQRRGFLFDVIKKTIAELEGKS